MASGYFLESGNARGNDNKTASLSDSVRKGESGIRQLSFQKCSRALYAVVFQRWLESPPGYRWTSTIVCCPRSCLLPPMEQSHGPCLSKTISCVLPVKKFRIIAGISRRNAHPRRNSEIGTSKAGSSPR